MIENIAKQAWNKYFKDDMDFLDKYFLTYYNYQNLIINIENNNEFIYMALIVRYYYKYYNEIIPIAYITAVLTNPKYRNQGYFRITMQEIFERLIKQEYIISFLIPASEELSDTYQRYGYSKCFIEKQEPNKNKSIIHEQKTINLYNELGYDISQLKPNTIGLLRIINAEKALILYAKNFPNKEITYKINDKQIKENNKIIKIKDGNIKVLENVGEFEEIEISELSHIIFQNSYMNLMFDK
jgi:Predicted acetyltransferase involved in intracellular survival and related acetyltransferases